MCSRCFWASIRVYCGATGLCSDECGFAGQIVIIQFLCAAAVINAQACQAPGTSRARVEVGERRRSHGGRRQRKDMESGRNEERDGARDAQARSRTATANEIDDGASEKARNEERRNAAGWQWLGIGWELGCEGSGCYGTLTRTLAPRPACPLIGSRTT